VSPVGESARLSDSVGQAIPPPAKWLRGPQEHPSLLRALLRSRTVAYLSAGLGIAAVTAICAPFHGLLNNTTVALAMLLVVLFAASAWGSRPALVASTLGALAFDYFFLPPFGTFVIGTVQDWVAFSAFFITAVTVGELSARARRRATESEAGRREAQLTSAYNRRLIEASLDPLVTIGRDGEITDLNAATEAATGRSRRELIGTDFSNYFTDPAKARAGYEQAFREGVVHHCALEIQHRDGTRTPVLYNASVYCDETGTVAGVFAAARDVSGLKQAESEIRRLASFPQLSPLPIIEFDRALRVRYVNPAMQQVLKECSVGNPLDFVPSRWAWELAQDDGLDTDASDVQEVQIAGRIFEERIFFSREFQSLRIWAADITERKQAEWALERLNHTLRTLSSANQALVRATNEPELLHNMCRVLIDAGGYRMAWIGLAEHDEDKTVRVAAVGGHDEGYTQLAQVSWADTERGRGPTGTAIRTGEPQINRNFATDPRLGLWRDEALKRGYASSVALPLKGPAGPLGALNIYAGEPQAFGSDEIQLFIELADDLAYGIAALRAHGEREQAVRRLHESLEDTIGAIASTVEMRDPYTAGHQRRVAKLAAKIAEEMGLAGDQTRGIFLAALIHDVGKINVPAEILSKPGKLTPIEIEFVRSHAQTGYDIIKGVEFPWPIAEAVLQHHERLDGSGYPRRLAGEAVIVEARILAVADVTEAMTAHRPYRPALGLDAALAEIESGKGRLYDPAAVDACIALFRTKGFAFQ
jgi:PAS domain S-box-containing protein/putative nucleotidyltransferase with HDIG domain